MCMYPWTCDHRAPLQVTEIIIIDRLLSWQATKTPYVGCVYCDHRAVLECYCPPARGQL